MEESARAIPSNDRGLSLVALAGNPNSGKTSVFNALTGLKYKVANYPGVTVEKKEGTVLVDDDQFTLIDLPGTYTLSGESIDEKVAAKVLAERPTAIIAVVDSTNLERNLYLITELIDLGLPLVLALNMSDLAEKRGITIRPAILSRLLDLPVVTTVAATKHGMASLKREIQALLQTKKISGKKFAWANGDSMLIETAKESSRLQQTENFGLVATARYKWINSIVREAMFQEAGLKPRISERIDAIVTHPVWGLVFFFLVMATIFQAIFSWAVLPMQWIDQAVSIFGTWIGGFLHEGALKSLLVDGIFAGVGSVLVFIPQIALLFLFIGILEDSGYLCRAAFVMDRVMRKVGLQGRSFIPLLSSFACAIPGIMSTRSIPSLADRFITILVAPLMSCSARIPVYTVLIAAFVPTTTVLGVFSLQGLVMFGVYFLGVAGAAVVAQILKLFVFRGQPTLFVMEMPPFRLPLLKLVLTDVRDRVVVFLKSAGTIILACSVVLWFLASHPNLPDGSPPPVQESYAGMMGTAIEPVIRPLGFNWEIGIGLITSFAAREVFVSTLSTVYNLQSAGESTESLSQLLKARHAAGVGFSIATVASLLVFYVFACQCMSTLAVCRRETGSWKWPAIMLAYMTVLAYSAAFVTYHLVQIWWKQ